MPALFLCGCQAMPKVDAPAESSRLSGITETIVIRDWTLSESTTAPSQPLLTRQQAMKLTLQCDPRIQSAMAKVRAAEADAKQARLLPNPILNVDFRYPKSGTTPVELTLTGDLVAVLEQPRQVSAADNRLRGAAAEAEATVLDALTEVETAYAQAQSLDAQLESIDDQRTLLQKTRDVSARRVDLGEGMRLDVVTIDAQMAQLTVDTADVESERVEQRMTLARLIGQSRGGADWKLEPWQPPQTVSAAESDWVDAALVSRPEVHSKAWELSALKDEVDLTKFEPFQGDAVGAHAEHDPNWRIGPTITSPVTLFDFGQDAKAKAQAEAIAAMHDLAEQRLEVIEDVRSAYQGYKVARKALDVAEGQLLPLLQEQRRLADLAYQSGDADFTTLLLAETTLDQTMQAIVELRGKASLAMIKLERAVGGAGVAAMVESAATTRPATTRPAPTQAAIGGPASTRATILPSHATGASRTGSVP